jgi:hypothetical protein
MNSKLTATEALQMAVGYAITYYALHPGKFDEHRDLVRVQVGRWAHKMSIWQAVASIRSLPETPET